MAAWILNGGFTAQNVFPSFLPPWGNGDSRRRWFMRKVPWLTLGDEETASDVGHLEERCGALT